MVSSCCICSKENVSSEPHRSFHRIPANEEMRNKWFHIIGRTVSYKGARICSDHFTENDYHDINPYSRIKRLKNTAVPSVILKKEKNRKSKDFKKLQKTAINLYNNSEIMFQNKNDIAFHNSETYEVNASNDISETKGSENANNEIVLTQDISKNLIVLLNSEKEINATRIDNKEKIDVNFENINNMNRERKFPSPNLANSEMRNKKILKFSKHSTVYFTKTDFSSDEKWTAFLKCIAYNKRENRMMRQKNKCLQKKKFYISRYVAGFVEKNLIMSIL